MPDIPEIGVHTERSNLRCHAVLLTGSPESGTVPHAGMSTCNGVEHSEAPPIIPDPPHGASHQICLTYMDSELGNVRQTVRHSESVLYPPTQNFI